MCVSLSNICSAARSSGCAPVDGRASRTWVGGQHCRRPLSAEHRPRLHAGAAREAAGSPGRGNLGMGPRKEKLVTVTAKSSLGGKKVGEEMKQPRGASACPRRGRSLPFPNERHTRQWSRRAWDQWETTGEGRTEAGAGGWGQLGGGAGAAALYKWHERCMSSSSWKSASSESRVLGWGVSARHTRVCVGSLAGAPAQASPYSLRPSGYTSVEKYSVFRFRSAKEMGGCCR